MMQLRKFYLIITLALLTQGLSGGRIFEVQSPAKTIYLKVEVGDRIELSVFHKTTLIVSPSPLSMTLRDHPIMGVNPVIREESRRSVDEVVHPVVIYLPAFYLQLGGDTTIAIASILGG